MEFYGDERTGQPAPQVGPLKGRRRGGIILAENLKIRFFGEKPVLPPKLPPNCVVKGETRRTGQDGRFPKIPINQRAMVLRGTRRDGGPRISRPVPSTTRSPIRMLAGPQQALSTHGYPMTSARATVRCGCCELDVRMDRHEGGAYQVSLR